MDKDGKTECGCEVCGSEGLGLKPKSGGREEVLLGVAKVVPEVSFKPNSLGVETFEFNCITNA